MANILIIKLGALGDVVISTSLIKQIQTFHSTDSIALLTSKPFHDLFQAWSGITTHSVERKGALNNLSTIKWIRKNKFNSIYDLQSNDRSGLYCAFSGAPVRIGNHPRYPYNLHPKTVYLGKSHIYDRMISVLESAGISAMPSLPFLPISEEGKQRVNMWVEKKGLAKKKFILIHPGGSSQHPEKRWPHYEKFAQMLSTKNKAIVWVGGADDREINNKLSSITGLDACMKFTFSELAELGRQASFAITNDSGPMHILSCSGIPVYAFFGPTNWMRSHAIGQERNIISAQINGKTPHKNNNAFSPASLKSISAETVVNRLLLENML